MRNVQEMEENKPPEFSLMECAAAAVDYTEIACPQHVNSPVKLKSVVPDLLLSDLPPELVIDNKVIMRGNLSFFVEKVRLNNSRPESQKC
jgi:hypothetical protein